MEAVYEFLLKAEHEVESYLLFDDKVNLVDGLPWILCSTLIWAVLFQLKTENPFYLSSLHATVLTIAGAVNLVLGHGEYEPYAFFFMIGYFISDFFINCLTPDSYVYGLHHVITVIASYRMINGRNWNETMFASSCWLMELSTPFLNHYLQHQTPLSGILLMLTFFLARVAWLARLSYTGWQVAINRLEFCIIIGFTALNYFWFMTMIMEAIKAQKKTKTG